MRYGYRVSYVYEFQNVWVSLFTNTQSMCENQIKLIDLRTPDRNVYAILTIM